MLEKFLVVTVARRGCKKFAEITQKSRQLGSCQLGLVENFPMENIFWYNL